VDIEGLKGLAGAELAGKRVLVRADLNVPMAGGKVSDATRIERLVPTLAILQQADARIILISHMGRPKGERVDDLSLAPVAAALDAMMPGTDVRFATDCIGPAALEIIAQLKDGDIAVLENLRFHAGEEANDPAFAQALAQLADVYVNDAFSCAHRAHASTQAIAELLPAYAGTQMLAELKALTRALGDPNRPVLAVVGGAKIASKIGVLTHLIDRVDALIIGGGMANTFLHAQGIDVANSLHEPDLAETAREILAAASAAQCDVLLPTDAVAAEAFEADAPHVICDVSAVPPGSMILDAGPKSLALFKERLAASKTVLWNGPLGAFEIAPFGEGTFSLAREAAKLTQSGALVSVAGGGDTVAALNAAGVTAEFSYVSAAGGAFLEWLEGRELPGVAALVQS
jgi:phosphoglycerate kinase